MECQTQDAPAIVVIRDMFNWDFLSCSRCFYATDTLQFHSKLFFSWVAPFLLILLSSFLFLPRFSSALRSNSFTRVGDKMCRQFVSFPKFQVKFKDIFRVPKMEYDDSEVQSACGHTQIHFEECSHEPLDHVMSAMNKWMRRQNGSTYRHEIYISRFNRLNATHLQRCRTQCINESPARPHTYTKSKSIWKCIAASTHQQSKVSRIRSENVGKGNASDIWRGRRWRRVHRRCAGKFYSITISALAVYRIALCFFPILFCANESNTPK